MQDYEVPRACKEENVPEAPEDPEDPEDGPDYVVVDAIKKTSCRNRHAAV
jgi:hypothetical protein